MHRGRLASRVGADSQPALAPPPSQLARTNVPTVPPAPRTTRSTVQPGQDNPLRGQLEFAMHSAELGAGGIDGRREDGTNVLVMWRDVVGLVVRLAPPEYDGHPIVDLISVGGSTLRLVPWTRLSGELVELEGEPRIRAFVALVLERVPAVQLDRATRAFVDELGPPRQLADREMLAAHDARIR